MKAGNLFRSTLVTLFVIGALSTWFVSKTPNYVTQAQAAISTYTASAFSQFCEANPSTCKKVNFSNVRVGAISCPSQNQVITQVYVHAGGGQTVYELPHDGFSYVLSNDDNTVTVTLTTHQNDISWIGITCTNSSITPTPTDSQNNTPTPTDSQNETPTPTDSQNETPTPTPTDEEECDPDAEICIILDCDGQGECVVDTNPSPTKTPTPTVTSVPANTPTPTQGQSSSNGDSSNNDNGTGGSTGSVLGTSTGGEVLGATTLADTGSFVTNLMNSIFALGTTLLTIAGGMYVKQKSN